MVDELSGAMGHWPINVDQIARELDVPEAAVREWTQRKTFPRPLVDNGRGPAWPLSRVRAWLETEEGQEALAEAQREQVNS